MALRRLSFTTRLQSDQAYTPVGCMDKRITLMNPALTGPGGITLDPEPFADTWASIKALFAQEKREAQQIVKEVIHEIIIPYMPGLSESMTVQFETRNFQIEGIMDPDEQHRELRLLCIERDQNA
jgi:SPP1 family predicted phage head-tail adaptor